LCDLGLGLRLAEVKTLEHRGPGESCHSIGMQGFLCALHALYD
jgi:hypothetical protein